MVWSIVKGSNRRGCSLCPRGLALAPTPQALSRKDEHFVDFIAILWYGKRKNVEIKMGVRIDLSIDQLAQVLKQPK